MRILAIDQASTSGFAVGGRRGVEASGVWDCSPKRDESKGMRILRFRSKFVEAAKGCDLVVWEVPAGPHKGAIRVSAQLESVMIAWCEDEHVNYRTFASTEIKKHATGKGNAKKVDVRAAVEAKHGPVEDDNESDAIAMLELAASMYDYDDVEVPF